MTKFLSSYGDHLNVAVIGATGGIGSAFLEHLQDQPHVERIYAFSRQKQDLNHGKVVSGALDFEEEESIAFAAKEIENPLHVVLIATGMLHDTKDVQPEKSLRDLNTENFRKILLVNTIGPALCAKYFVPKLPRDRKSVFAALSARVGSISDNRLGGWYSYRSSKAALNMVLKTTAIEVARKQKEAIIIGLHPGTVDTNLSQPFQNYVKEGKLFTPAYATECMLGVLDGLMPEQSGKVFAWDGAEVPA